MQVFNVQGMTCGHCVSAVQQEIGAIDGVAAVSVDLASGEVTITSGRQLSADEVAAAVDEAGYELAS